ncbi:MAG: dolichyl-phosphate mannose synthase [Actinomycetia bacterium]|nr:dolichyl-phosphate mannose synthase [Actinomycetes bacterium]
MAVDTLVIIPAYNEEAALPAVLAGLRARFPAFDLVVIDDGSADRTSEVARAGGAAVVTLPFNLGVGGALRTGFRYAVRHGYQRAVQLDADGQHDAGQVDALLAALDGADLVIGSRFADGPGDYEVGRSRRLAMRFMQRGVRILSGRSFTDTSSGFRAFGPRSLDLFADQYPIDFLSDSVEALLTALAAGLTVVEVPVHMNERAGGVPSTRSLKLVYHYLRLLVVMTATAPRRSAR